MQINEITSRPAGSTGSALSDPEIAGKVAVLSGDASLPQQLDAYHALSDSWRGARSTDRAALAGVLNETPFGQRVQSVLNSFTRAAWPGAGAAPPAPQESALSAFQGLSEDDRAIVASMQTDPSTGTRYASADDYGRRLKTELDEARTGLRRSDTVTLSAEARARLAGAEMAKPVQIAPAARPAVAEALTAYARLA